MLYFRFDKHTVDSTYRTNREEIKRLAQTLMMPEQIQSICMDVSTSPEGLQSHNFELSDQRESSIIDYIIDISDSRLTREAIHINLIREDWDGLLEKVRKNYFRHDRDKLIYILTNKKLSGQEKWQIIKDMNEGYTFNILQKNYFPALRYVKVYKIRRNP